MLTKDSFILKTSYPKGYRTLFWARLLGNFCFYGLKSVLVLYLTLQFLWSDQKAFGFYGTFMALTYLMPTVGGWFSDQVFGIRYSILIGGWSVFMGCLFLSFQDERILYWGLSFVSIGLGFVKPTTISAVGLLFPDQVSNNRDSAYTTFYVGMNIGSFLGPLVCGWLGYHYGWHFVFLLTGGVVLGASLFFHFVFKNHPLFKQQILRGIKPHALSFGRLSLVVFSVFFLLFYGDQMPWLMPVIILGSMGCLGFVFFKTTGQERRNVGQIGILMAIFAVFASLFEQTGSSLTLFIERGVERSFWDNTVIPSPFFQSLNPAFVIGFGPLIARYWASLERQRIFLPIFGKFALGFLFMGASFLILGMCIRLSSSPLLSPLWIVVMSLFQVVGELCIVPIGFSAVSKLAPRKFSTMVMGLWMVSISCGHYVGALLAKFSSPPLQNNEMTPSFHPDTYATFFLHMSLIPFTAFLVIGLGLLWRRCFQIPLKR